MAHRSGHAPYDARWVTNIASPFFDAGRVFVAMGQSPGYGNGPSLIHAISASGWTPVPPNGPAQRPPVPSATLRSVPSR